MFPGSSIVLGSHQYSIPQGVGHLSCAADVWFAHTEVRLGPAARCSVASIPARSLPLVSFPRLFLLRGRPVSRPNLEEWSLIPHLLQVLKDEVHVGLRSFDISSNGFL